MRFNNLLSMQALIIEIILVLAGFLVLPSPQDIDQPCAADWTFDQPR